MPAESRLTIWLPARTKYHRTRPVQREQAKDTILHITRTGGSTTGTAKPGKDSAQYLHLIMNQLFRRCIGIDISKRKFTACISSRGGRERAPRDFHNDIAGFRELCRWAGATDGSLFLMEATGVYHEPLATWLHDEGLRVCVILPARAKKFAEAEGARTKTDASDSEMLSRLGIRMQQIPLWTPPDPLWRRIRTLTRMRSDITRRDSDIRCRLEALSVREDADAAALYREMLAGGKRFLRSNEAAIRTLVQTRSGLKKRIAQLETIPGIGFLTAVTILAETDAFRNTPSARALTCFAGLDVRQTQSGTSVHGRSRISKMGNAHLRAALYMPALTAVRCSATFRSIADGISARHPESRKIAVTAIQRRLLLVMFSLWKNGAEWRPAGAHPC